MDKYYEIDFRQNEIRILEALDSLSLKKNKRSIKATDVKEYVEHENGKQMKSRSSFYFSMKKLIEYGFIKRTLRGYYSITEMGLEHLSVWHETQRHQKPVPKIGLIIESKDMPTVIWFLLPRRIGVHLRKVSDFIKNNREYVTNIFLLLLDIITGFKLKLPDYGYSRERVTLRKLDDLAIIIWRESDFETRSARVMLKAFESKLCAYLSPERVQEIKTAFPNLTKNEIKALNVLANKF